MRAKRLVLSVAGLACAFGMVAGLAAASAPSWGHAIEVPGTYALNVAGNGGVTSLSCASAHNCSAGGYVSDASGGPVPPFSPFVTSEKGGVWRTAALVKGMAALNVGGEAEINSVSCGSAGNCLAGGFYSDNSGRQAFVVSETSWVWGKAVELKGTAALSGGRGAVVTSVSCRGLPGNCAVGGYYWDNAGRQAFVATEKSGMWHAAIEVPGTAALNADASAQVTSVSCASAGNCLAGGEYTDGSSNEQAFVVTETKGVWAAAIEVPGTAALNVSGFAGVTTVSCATAGNCSAGGSYGDADARQEAFVANETNGVWSDAIEVPGIASLNLSSSSVTSLSCSAAGECSAGGYYEDIYGNSWPFVVSETAGVWGNAQSVAVPNTFIAEVTSLSCGSPGNCAAGGVYTDSSNQSKAFVLGQVNGTWGPAEKVPDTDALSNGGAGITTVSCSKAGSCALGGNYTDLSNARQPFVTSP